MDEQVDSNFLPISLRDFGDSQLILPNSFPINDSDNNSTHSRSDLAALSHDEDSKNPASDSNGTKKKRKKVQKVLKPEQYNESRFENFPLQDNPYKTSYSSDLNNAIHPTSIPNMSSENQLSNTNSNLVSDSRSNRNIALDSNSNNPYSFIKNSYLSNDFIPGSHIINSNTPASTNLRDTLDISNASEFGVDSFNTGISTLKDHEIYKTLSGIDNVFGPQSSSDPSKSNSNIFSSNLRKTPLDLSHNNNLPNRLSSTNSPLSKNSDPSPDEIGDINRISTSKFDTGANNHGDLNKAYRKNSMFDFPNPRDVIRGKPSDQAPKVAVLSPMPLLNSNASSVLNGKKSNFPLGPDYISTTNNFNKNLIDGRQMKNSQGKDGSLSLSACSMNDTHAKSDDKIRMLENYYLSSLNLEDSAPEEKLRQILSIKYSSGVLKPFNYVNGYLRMHRFMEKNMSSASVTKLIGILSVYRSTFMMIIKSLTDADVLVSEVAFEKLLFDYTHIFRTFGTPACLWRRTGEIFKANKQFADLVGLPLQYFREGRITIYELMTEESTVNYIEKYTNVAFDVTQKAVLTSCVLQVSDIVKDMISRDQNNGSWGGNCESDLEPLPIELGDRGDRESFLNSLKESPSINLMAQDSLKWDAITAKMVNEMNIADGTFFPGITFSNPPSKDLGSISFQGKAPDSSRSIQSASGLPNSSNNNSNIKTSITESRIDTTPSYLTKNSKNTSDRVLQEENGRYSKSSSKPSAGSYRTGDKFIIPKKKLPCCFSITIRRDKNSMPIAVVGNFMPINN
ncbi:Regulator of drug sensitivity 2 [Smittium mucronatum]|uniref:Regulator of drug sensitivity 2 n=1 Tax=Smittium mucronatum TaxID=133383 RepID=A0A1R0H8D0_9FUNG|nr:Regulator of drug sensitivity 2 [Smittium mucronatum]